MTPMLEQIAAAGAAAVAGMAPLTDAEVAAVAVLLAPLTDRRECWRRIPEGDPACTPR